MFQHLCSSECYLNKVSGSPEPRCWNAATSYILVHATMLRVLQSLLPASITVMQGQETSISAFNDQQQEALGCKWNSKALTAGQRDRTFVHALPQCRMVHHVHSECNQCCALYLKVQSSFWPLSMPINANSCDCTYCANSAEAGFLQDLQTTCRSTLGWEIGPCLVSSAKSGAFLKSRGRCHGNTLSICSVEIDIWPGL